MKWTPLWRGLTLALLLTHATARGDNLPLPQGLSLDQVARAVVCTELQLPRAAVLDAYDGYVKSLEGAVIAADADLVHLYRQSRAPAGAYMGLRDAARYNEIDERSQEAARVLVDALVTQLALAAPGQDEKSQLLRQALQLANEYGQIRGGTSGMIEVRSPHDLWDELHYAAERISDAAFAAERRTLLLVQTANASGRLKAMRAFQEAIRQNRLDQAKVVEECKVVGRLAEDVRAEDQERYMEAQHAGNDPVAYRAAYDRAQSLSATNKLMPFFLGPPETGAAWAQMVKEQLNTYAQVEAQLPPTLAASANRFWLPSLVGRPWRDLQLPLPEGSWNDDPPGFIQSLLRLKGLDDAARTKVRALGAEWLAADASIYREAANAFLARGSSEDPAPKRQELADAMVVRLAAATHLPELTGAKPAFPAQPLTAELSAEDERNFGEVPKPQPRTEAAERSIARSAGRPWKYAPDMVNDLSALLRLTPDQRAILEVTVADARDRWAQSVAPLVEKSIEPESGHLRSYDEFLRWKAKFDESMGYADRAFQAAYDCDARLFADLNAALSGGVPTDALKLAAAARRTAEGTLPLSRDSDAGVVAVPVDLPRAVLTAPLSATGRQAAIAAIAPHALQWDALGRDRSKVIRPIRQLALDGSGSAPDAEGAQQRAARKQAFAEAFARVNDAWAIAERESIEIVANALAAEDAAAWRSAVRRLRWPACYYSIDEIRRAAEAALDRSPDAAALRPRVEAILKNAEADAQRSGDAAVAMMEALPLQLDPLKYGALGRNSASRLRAMRTLDWSRATVVAERVRILLPEAVPIGPSRSAAIRRLAAMEAQLTP